jgi:hypothetical protein
MRMATGGVRQSLERGGQMNAALEFANALRGVILRQYHKTELGGTFQKVLEFHDGGLCLYYEIHRDADGGGYRTESEHGQWVASGTFPVGQVRITWADVSTTEHEIEYHGGDTCRFDGIVTAVE